MTFDPNAPQVPKTPNPLALIGYLVMFGLGVSQMYRGYRQLFPKAPQAGDQCNAGTAACVNSTSALFCRNGRMEIKACDGVGGCQTNGDRVQCRFNTAAIGEECTESGSSCSADRSQMLSCVNGRMVALGVCAGPRRCSTQQSDAGAALVLCDGMRSAPGAPCSGNSFACSTDGQAGLHCQNGSMQVVSYCRGPGGCSVDSEYQVHCDRTVMVLGEVCTGTGAACDATQSNILQCNNGVVTLLSACEAPARCVSENNRLNCVAPPSETAEAPAQRRRRHR